MLNAIATSTETRKFLFRILGIVINFNIFSTKSVLLFSVKESPIHRYLFWVATSVLELDEASLYASGLALLEQNLHTLDSQGTFDEKVCTL